MLITAPEDVDVLVDGLLAGSAYSNVAVLYSLERTELPSGFPDHELRVGVDRDREVGVVAFMDETGNWVPDGSLEGPADIRYFLDGEPVEFPPCSEVPLVVVREALREFLTTRGNRPKSIGAWKDQYPDE
ncbi:Imm1 family immunity protein [Dactylosporangium sp. CA-092794]|uniref:Imm1 family immunity protein n=1 Tax=Dactylosporangium sp. CA-092794 TaxID=3239929 RepID=UPI003D8B702B